MSVYTEADEACRGNPLLALGNIRYQMVMGESKGMIDYYADAAIRCGLKREDVRLYIKESQSCFGKSAYVEPLCSPTQAYMAGAESADGYASFISASFIDLTTTH